VGSIMINCIDNSVGLGMICRLKVDGCNVGVVERLGLSVGCVDGITDAEGWAEGLLDGANDIVGE
jgi:hypothetical protein